MKTCLLALLLFCLLPCVSFSSSVTEGMAVKTNISTYSAKLGSLLLYDGLLFYKSYADSQASLDADYSVGLPTATFTSARSASAPATYVDASGVVQTVTSANTPRYQGGYYDSTGFHAQSGVMIEEAATNSIPKSSVFNDATWDATNMTVTDNQVASPDGTTNAALLTATNTNATLLLHTALTKRTFSIWIKRKTGTGNIDITANGGSSWTTVSTSTSWSRFWVTVTSASQTCGVRIATSGDEVYVWGAQFESRPWASSYIPTAGSARTRPIEGLAYRISRNRNVLYESMFIRFAPLFSNTSMSGIYLQATGTDTKVRNMLYNGDNADWYSGPNTSDSNSCQAEGGSLTQNTLSTYAYTLQPTSSYYIRTYINGSSVATDSSHSWVPNAWGTYFYVGSGYSGGGTCNCVIQSISIWNNYVSSTNVAAISTIHAN